MCLCARRSPGRALAQRAPPLGLFFQHVGALRASGTCALTAEPAAAIKAAANQRGGRERITGTTDRARRGELECAETLRPGLHLPGGLHRDHLRDGLDLRRSRRGLAGRRRGLYVESSGRPVSAIEIMTAAMLERMRLACQLAAEALLMVGPHIRPGISTDDINTLVHNFTLERGAWPSPLNYKGFPKSVC